jgi:hypothetical protein
MFDAYFIMPTLSEEFDKVHWSFLATAFGLNTPKGSCRMESLQSTTDAGPKNLRAAAEVIYVRSGTDRLAYSPIRIQGWWHTYARRSRVRVLSVVFH